MNNGAKPGAAGRPQEHGLRPRRQAYWKRNLRLVAGCLAVWFVVSYAFGILLVEPLNAFSLGGYPLGFWFAQQGSIYAFVALIFFYAWRMNRLDREFNVHED
jgi:putative solute:sodium symporter small subunit